MKILYISLSSSPGMQRYARNICNEASKNNEVTILCTKYYNIIDFDKKINMLNIVSTKTPRLEISTFNLMELYKVSKIIKKVNPEVIHFLSDHPWNFPLSIILNDYKTVHTIHDPVPHPDEKVAIFKKINNYLVINKLQSKIVLHGNSYIDYLEEKLKLKKQNFEVIHLGTEKRTKETVSIPNENNVLFFGRIKPYKGLDNFIEAVEILIRQNQSVKGIIAGEGNLSLYQSRIKNISNFEILNYSIPESDIEALFKNSKVVVLPYKSATQSGIIPISYYYGKPVVVTNVGSIKEFVDDAVTGYLVDSNPESIAAGIKRILNNNNLYVELASNAINKLNNDLSLESMVNKMIKYYKKIK